jgi:hypothetical protein
MVVMSMNVTGQSTLLHTYLQLQHQRTGFIGIVLVSNKHQLLCHRSGIPHNEATTDYWRLKSRLPLTKEQALAEIFSLHLLFEPGTGMKYSCPGYFLLACILESNCKQSSF